MDDLMGTGSVAAGYGEVYFGDHVGDEDKDWSSGEEMAIGTPNGISRAIRRCKASFCADNSIYFCIDSFYTCVKSAIRNQICRGNYPV